MSVQCIVEEYAERQTAISFERKITLICSLIDNISDIREKYEHNQTALGIIDHLVESTINDIKDIKVEVDVDKLWSFND